MPILENVVGAQNQTVRLNQQFALMAGLTDADAPKIFHTDNNGNLKMVALAMSIQQTGLCGNGEVQTAVVDANYTALAALACAEVRFFNYSGVDILMQQDGAGVAITIPNNAITEISGITNASQLAVKRKTGSGQVLVQYRWKTGVQWRVFSPTGYVLDSNGNPVLDSQGNPIQTS